MKEVIIHLICTDRKGIIARFTNKLYQNKINIISLEQHVEPDEDIFFMRIHADISNMLLDKNNFSNLISDFKNEKSFIDMVNKWANSSNIAES